MYRKRIYFNLLQTQVHLLYGCTFFFLLALSSWWWFYLYAPLCASNDSLEHNLSFTYKKLQSQKLFQKTALDLQKKFSEFKISMSGSGHKKDAALCSLVALAQKNNLQVVNARIGRCKKKSWCMMQEMHAECRGTYDQLISFFDQLTQNKPLINCKSCDITHGDKQMFTMRATFATYSI